MVFQRPCGILAGSLRPRGAHPRKGAMSVLVQISSMKTSRSGSTRLWYFVHCARRLAMSGRSRSPATTLFLNLSFRRSSRTETRLKNDASTEFETALAQIERIAPLGLQDRLPN
jgi:hypothetical protein